MFTNEEDLKREIESPVESRPEYKWEKQWSEIDGGLVTLAWDNNNRKWLELRGEKKRIEPHAAPLLNDTDFVVAAEEEIDRNIRWITLDLLSNARLFSEKDSDTRVVVHGQSAGKVTPEHVREILAPDAE